MNLVIADHTLKSYMGHSFEYARSLRDHAQTLGHKVTTLAARQVSDEVIRELDAIPCFRFDLFHQFQLPAVCSLLPQGIRIWLSDEWNYFRHSGRIRRDLCTVEHRIPINPDTLMLFPTVGFNDIEPVVRWAEQLPATRCPWIALVFHFTAFPDYSQPFHRSHYYTRALRYLEKSKRCARFRLFADSRELAEEYADYTQLPVQVLPIPHTEPMRPEAPTWRHAVSPIRLMYLGDARRNKGFHLLPQLFQQLERTLGAGLVQGEVQANVRFADEWQVVHAARRLKQQEGVTLHDRELTSSEYYDLLERADIVLLPYTQENYHSQTSGIFAEALAAGKPVVVPRGTWMARELRQSGAGVTFLPGDRRSLYEACLQAVQDWQPLRARAQEDARRWREQHSPATYLRLVKGSLVTP